MMDPAAIITIISVLAGVILAIAIVLAILLYHQMLLFNEINKRILVKSMEDQEKYEGALSQLAEAEAQLQKAADTIIAPKGPLDDADDEIHDIDLDN